MCSLVMSGTPAYRSNIPIYGSGTTISGTSPDRNIDPPEHVTDREIIDVCGGAMKLQYSSIQEENTPQETADRLLALAQQLMVMRQSILRSPTSCAPTSWPPATPVSQHVPCSAFSPPDTAAPHPPHFQPCILSVSSAWIPYSKLKRELPVTEESAGAAADSSPRPGATHPGSGHPGSGPPKFVLMEDMSYQCHVCGYKAKQHNQILRHWKIHSGERPYSCNQCEYSAALKHNLVQHMWSRHSRIKKYKCNECDYSATRKDYLASHKTQHTGKKPFKCDICSWTTGLRSNMTQHMKRKH